MQNNQNNQYNQNNQNTQSTQSTQNNPYNQQRQYQQQGNQQYGQQGNQQYRQQQRNQQYGQRDGKYNQYYAQAVDTPIEAVPEQYRPIGIWGHVGYFILFAIPVIGLIFAIIFSFNDSNYARRNLARAMAIVGGITLVLGILNLTTGFTLFGIADYTGIREFLEDVANSAY